MVQAGLDAQSDIGVLANYKLRYLRKTTTSGWRIAFTDMTQEISTTRNLLRNLLLIGGRRDTIAPPHWMIEPLWRELEALPTQSHHKKVLLDTNHGLDNARLELIQTMGEWIQEVVED